MAPGVVGPAGTQHGWGRCPSSRGRPYGQSRHVAGADVERPAGHCLEGRRWDAFCAALGGERPILSRPPLGNYDEQSLRGLYFAPDSIKLTRHVTPASTIEQSEVENIPFTGYANSRAFTFLKMAVSVAYGSAGMTLNLFDHLGTRWKRMRKLAACSPSASRF